MPIIPPPAAAATPYDSVEYVLNIARSLGNDAIQSLAGNLLSSTKAYVQVYLNSAYRYLQRKLANSGYQTFKKTQQVLALTPVITRDPGVRVSLGYSGYFDGTNNNATPVLPADLCWPLRLRERQNATTQMFKDMFIAHDGLQSRPQGIWLRDWIWENDSIVMNGAIQSNDLEMMYVPFLPDLVLGLNPASLVKIIRCENALAAYTLAMFAMARGSELATQCLTLGDSYTNQMLASDSMMKQRGNYRRKPYSRRA